MKSSTTPVTTPARPKVPAPPKPWPDFPLYWHPRGYWMKKHRGRELRFTADAAESFGRWQDHLAAERRGESATARRRRYLLKDAVNLYLTRQKKRHDEGRLSDVRFAICRQELEVELPKSIALGTPLDEFCSDDPGDTRPGELFTKIASRARRRGLEAASRHIGIVRAMMDYAARKRIMRAPDYGEEFDKPDKSRISRHRHELDAKHGERAWTMDELKTILTAAQEKNVHLYAQSLLGLFAGYGSDDCSALPDRAVNWQTGFVKFPRVKNGKPRVAWLPPVVMDALKVSRTQRAKAANRIAEGLMFRTKRGTKCNAAKHQYDDYGILRAGRNDTIGKNFTRHVDRLELQRFRAGFKTLRAMCRTMMVGAGVDEDLIRVVMGRTFRHPVDDYYIRGDLRDQLVKVGRHIEGQLFPLATRTQSPHPNGHADNVAGKKPTQPKGKRRAARSCNGSAPTPG